MLKRYTSRLLLVTTLFIFSISNVIAETQNTVVVDSDFDDRFIGKWAIAEHGVEYEILKTGTIVTIKGSDAVNNEAFEVYDVLWEKPQLRASFKMPSTNHVTHSHLKLIDQNSIEDNYTGDAAGQDIWVKID